MSAEIFGQNQSTSKCFQLQRLHVDIFQFFIVLSYILEIILKWSAI